MTYLDDHQKKYAAYKVELIVKLGWRDDTTAYYFDFKQAALDCWKRLLFGEDGRGYPGSLTLYDQANGKPIMKQIWS